MLKRGPLIVVGIIVLVLLATPMAIGMINENAMHRRVERMTGAGVLETRIADIDRGWFDTKARLEIGISPDYLSAVQGGQPDPMVMMMFGGFTLPVIVDIKHGPLLFDDGFGIGTASVHAYVEPGSDLATLADQFFGMPYIFDFRGRSGFGSGLRYEGEVPPIDIALPDVSVTSSGITFAGVFGGSDSATTGELASLSLQSPFASAILEALTFHSDMRRASPESMPTGDTRVALARVAVSDPLQGAAGSFAVEDVGMDSTIVANDSGDRLDVSALYSVGRVSVPGGFELSNAEVGLKLGNIDRQSADEFFQLANTLTATADPDAMLALLEPLGERLLAGNPELAIDPLRFSMPEGDFEGRAAIAINAGALPTGSLNDLQNQAIAMAALSLAVDMTASKALVETLGAQFIPIAIMPNPDGSLPTPAEIEMQQQAQLSFVLLALTAQGMLVDTGETYTTSIRLENGEATANGQLIPLGL